MPGNEPNSFHVSMLADTKLYPKDIKHLAREIVQQVGFWLTCSNQDLIFSNTCGSWIPPPQEWSPSTAVAPNQTKQKISKVIKPVSYSLLSPNHSCYHLSLWWFYIYDLFVFERANPIFALCRIHSETCNVCDKKGHKTVLTKYPHYNFLWPLKLYF